ncbi:MAG: hypothetical protein L0196_09595 [candidate division Zixibacteria bacterium]|nr:hypothetical protein [candidate division Zixibacteria bacterium]
MKPVLKIFLIVGWGMASSTTVAADSLPEATGQLTRPLHPQLEILAETVRVTVKNRLAITKILLVLRNPAPSALATGFHFPFTKKDTLVDFGVSRKSVPLISEISDSAPPLATLDAFVESPDSASADSQSFLARLAPGETVSVLLVYQTAPGNGDENRLRYVFPLKESFQTKGAIGSFAFYADIEEKSRIMEVRTESYPIVVRGNGSKRQAYFYQNNLRPKADVGFSYRLEPKKPRSGP